MDNIIAESTWVSSSWAPIQELEESNKEERDDEEDGLI